MRAGDSRAFDGLLGALVTSAARRWPPASRQEHCREWTAELAALRGEPRSGLRRFTFALSLALSPAPDDGSGLRGWRELLPVVGARLRPAIGFAVLSLLVMQVWPLRFNPFGYVSESGRSISNQSFDPWGWNLPVGVLLAWSVVPLCYLVGRRSSAAATGLLGIAGVATVGAALGYLAYRTAPLLADAWVLDGQAGAVPFVYRWRPPPAATPSSDAVMLSGPILPEGYAAAALVFVAMTAPLLAGVLFLTVRRRWHLGVPLACVGLPVMAILAWRVGVAVSPGPTSRSRFFDPIASIMGTRLDRGPFGLGELKTEESFVGTLLLLGTMVTAYCLGLATRGRTRAPAAAVPPPTDSTPAWTLARATTAVGCVAAVVGLATWVYATSMLPLWSGRDAAVARVVAESGDELRWGTVILAVLGVRIAAAHRRGATLAAFLVGGWLLTAEAVLTRPHLIDGPLPVGTAAAVAVLGVGLAWWVSGPRGQLGDTDPTAVRRALTVAAVVAAACGPLLIAQVDIGHGTAVPVGLTVVLSAVPATFVALAVFAAAAARRQPVGPGFAAVLAVAPVCATALVGIAAAAAAVDRGVTLLVGAAAAGLFATGAAALAVARRGRPEHWVGWAVAVGLAPFVVAPAVFYAAIVPDMLLRAVRGVDAYPVAATSFQPGVLLVVLPAAAMLARWLIHDDPTSDAALLEDAPAVQLGLSTGSPPSAPAGA